MTPERWRQIKQVFDQALQRESHKRPAYLDGVCAGDAELRSEVESLLAAHEHAGEFIDSAALSGNIASLEEFSESKDQLLGRHIGPYRILRELGHGGMGIVYEAVRDDEEFVRKVAIKLVSRGMDSEFVVRRFRNERQILADLDHPNIARLFDGGTTSDGLPYFVMEFIEGRPIHDYCNENKLSTEARIKLFREVCSAVHYAHQKHVVHRDIKPGNILVTSQRVPKLLDFGIAKILASEASPQTYDATVTVMRMMTPHYASPEQIRGEPVSPASDIYCLGVVLFELLTGHRPYRLKGQAPHEIAQAICSAEVEKPSTAISRVEQIPTDDGTGLVSLTPEVVSSTRHGDPEKLRHKLAGDLDAIVLKALRKEPALRYQSAGEFSADLQRYLDKLPVAARQAVWGYQSRQFVQRHKALIGTFAVFVALLAGFTLFLQTETGDSLRSVIAQWVSGGLDGTRDTQLRVPAGSTASPRRSVALLGFKNLSGSPEVAWLSTAFSEMLATELAAGEKLRTIPGENVARVKLELALAEAESFGKDTLTRLRANLGADVVVLGAYTVLGPKGQAQIRLDLKLQDAAVGETFAAIKLTGSEEGLLDLVARTGTSLRQELGVGEVSVTDAAGIRASLPSSPEAAKLYAEGLERLRLFDALAARDLLAKAVQANPEYPLAHAALAEAWSSLGYDEKAKQEAKLAFDLSANLSREERLSIEGRYLEMQKRWSEAVEIYKSLFNFFPDNLEYGLRLAHVQTSAGSGREALPTVERLRKLPKPPSDDPRIDLAEAQAAESLSDFKREVALEVKAAEKGRQAGAQLLVARARLLESRALRNLGQVKESRAASEEAKQIYATHGHREGVARATNNLAALLSDDGDLEGARRLHEEALAICRQIGDKACMASALNNLAIRLKDTGNLSAALKMHESALTIRRETGDKSGIAVSLNNIAVVLYGQDDLRGAKKIYEESLAICREIGEKRGIVRAQHNLSLVLKDQGDLATAKRMQEESLAIRKGIGDRRGIAMVQLNIGLILLDEGDLSGARRIVEEALKGENETNHRRGVAYDLFTLGQILMAQGDLPGARKSHEAALKIREELGEKGTAAESRVSLAAVAIEENRFAEAETLARRSAAEFQNENIRAAETEACLVLAQALLAQKRIAEARSVVDRALSLSGKTERRYLALSTGLTAARVGAALGRTAEAQRSLETILAEATKIGYLGLQLEARLALIEIDPATRISQAKQTKLAALRREAEAKGFGLIARKASAV